MYITDILQPRSLQQTFDLSSANELARWQNECRLVDERLLNWQQEFAATQFQNVRQRFAFTDETGPDKNVLMVRTMFDTYVPLYGEYPDVHSDKAQCHYMSIPTICFFTSSP